MLRILLQFSGQSSTKISPSPNTFQYEYTNISSNYNGSVCIANYGGANYDLYVNYGASFVTYTLAGYSFFKFKKLVTVSVFCISI